MSERLDPELHRATNLNRAVAAAVRGLQSDGLLGLLEPEDLVASALGLPTSTRPALADAPFAPSGLPGTFDVAVFSQDEVWVDGAHGLRLVAPMSPADRAEILEFCVANVEQFWSQAAAYQIMGLRVGELALLDEAGVPLVAELDAFDWLERTPLVRALRS